MGDSDVKPGAMKRVVNLYHRSVYKGEKNYHDDTQESDSITICMYAMREIRMPKAVKRRCGEKRGR